MKEKYIRAHMDAARRYAQLSTCKRRQVGCLIIKDNNPIAMGYNGTPPGEDNQCEDEFGNSKPDVIHAEDNALRKLTRSHESAQDSSVFVTTAPCKLCAIRLVEAGVKIVYYNDIYRNEDGLLYLQKHGIETIRVKGEE
jgi:dCMP deaminase